MKILSAIVPVYNEEKALDKTFNSILEYSEQKPEYHFIFVNDGSQDSTQDILKQKIATAPNQDRISLVSYQENRGKGYAVRQGVKYADGDYICFIDGDLAYSLDHLEKLAEKLESFDVVIGCRHLNDKGVSGQNILRKISGKVFNILSRKILNLEFTDMQAGLKGFRKPAAKHLFEKQVICGFSFDVELIYIARKFGYSIGQIPAKVSETHLAKQSKVNLFKDSIIMFFNLLQIRDNDRKGRYD